MDITLKDLVFNLTNSFNFSIWAKFFGFWCLNFEKNLEFNKKEIFDENFFLYFEEFDLCKSLIKINKKIYTSNKLKIHHLGFKSSLEENTENNFNSNNVREWHWMWSSFYFYKKNYNYVYAFYQMFGKFVRSFLRLLFYFITFQKNKREKYLYRFLGLYNAFLNQPSHFRGKK